MAAGGREGGERRRDDISQDLKMVPSYGGTTTVVVLCCVICWSSCKRSGGSLGTDLKKNACWVDARAIGKPDELSIYIIFS